MEHIEQSGILVLDEELAEALDDGSARRGWRMDLKRKELEREPEAEVSEAR